MDSSQVRLEQLGYRQELKRVLSHASNFAVSFSLMSILSGVTASFSLGYVRGGPVIIVWAWVIHFVMAQFILGSMAELCSSMPTAGGLFSWSFQLGGRHRRLWTWITGWMSLIAWIAGTASAAFAFAYLVSIMVSLSGELTIYTNAQTLGIIAAVLVAQGLLCQLPIRYLGWINQFSVCWNVGGAVTLIILLPSVAPNRQSAEFVFTNFDSQALGHIVSNGYSFLLGYMFAVYCQSGMDSAVHVSEETVTADRGAARNLVFSFWANSIYGFAFVLSILFSMQETSALILSEGKVGGFLIAEIYVGVFQARFGSSTGAVIALGIPLIAIFLGGLSSMLIASRVLWAFARDGALPLSDVWKRVQTGSGVPRFAVGLSTLLCICLSLPILGSTVAYSACISVTLLAGCSSYLIPFALKVATPSDQFVRGPIHLGAFSRPFNCMACVYLLFICSIAVMPTEFPITTENLNYAPVAYGIFLIIILCFWFLPGKLGARAWYVGKRDNLIISPGTGGYAGLSKEEEASTWQNNVTYKTDI